MSYNNKKTSKKNTTPTPFCTVCFNAGKLEIEYRSHYVKSEASGATKGSSSVVVCPLIKSIECKYCHNTGHTVKYCSMLKEKEKNKGKDSKKQTTTVTPVSPKQEQSLGKQVINKLSSAGGYFNNLMDDDEEGVVEESNQTPVRLVKCWAEVAAQPVPTISISRPPVPVSSISTQPVQAQSQLQPPPPTPIGFSFPRISREISWADYTSDSDDDVY